MSEPVDLDGIEARAKDPRYSREFLGSLALRDQPALVAEVRALRAKVEKVNDYADSVVLGKSLWMALDLRIITAGARVVFGTEVEPDERVS